MSASKPDYPVPEADPARPASETLVRPRSDSEPDELSRPSR